MSRMKCSICGQESQVKAKLCPHCRAALHRTFAETVTQPPPMRLAGAQGTTLSQVGNKAQQRAQKRAMAASASALLAEHRKAEKADALDAAKVEPGDIGLRWKVLSALIMLAAFAGVLYVAYRVVIPDVHDAGVDAVESPVGPGPSRADLPAAGATNGKAEPNRPGIANGTASGAAVNAQRAGDGAMPTAAPAQTPMVATSAAPTKPLGSKAKPRPLPATMPPVEVDLPPPPVVAQAPVEVPRPAVLQEAPKPDKWQLMNTALSRCGDEPMIGRIQCEQKVRQQYCAGSWGVVAQCAQGMGNDYLR